MTIHASIPEDGPFSKAGLVRITLSTDDGHWQSAQLIEWLTKPVRNTSHLDCSIRHKPVRHAK